MTESLNIVELGIEQARTALSSGLVSAVELVARHLERVAYYDRQGLGLNAIPILNPDMFEEAAESDRRYQEGGESVRALEGIPFTVKDSFMVRGLTVASGSPAFVNLIASSDAFTVDRLRAARAVLLGKTNMPPMAAGGMQRGAYGRSESPYNTAFMPAAYASGSSHGSGVSTATSMAVFGMGEETLSSGRSPASNNSLCAYTPSRGLLSMRGNWPLFPTRDVIVPHTRSMEDLLAILDVIMVSDTKTRGDFWRQQTQVYIPKPEEVRPNTFLDLAQKWSIDRPLEGKKFGVPRMYLGKDDNIDIRVRTSILDLWRAAADRLTYLGATVVECDFPIVNLYEGRNPTSEDLASLGVFPQGWMGYELGEFMWWAWDDFLRANSEEATDLGLPAPQPSQLGDAIGDQIFPLPKGALSDRYDPRSAGALDHDSIEYGARHQDVPSRAQQGLVRPHDLPGFEEGLKALEAFREDHYEAWLQTEGLDGLIFPANTDVASADSDMNKTSADHAWSNGVLYSTGNYMIRHLGIPSVTVPMGSMSDINMPIGLTFIGPTYHDMEILGWAYAFEADGSFRTQPTLTPPILSDIVPALSATTKTFVLSVTVSAESTLLAPHRARIIHMSGSVKGLECGSLRVSVNGVVAPVKVTGSSWSAKAIISASIELGLLSASRDTLVVVTAKSSNGGIAATYCEL